MDKKILVYVVLGVIILTLLVLTAFPNMAYEIKDFGSSDSEDICSPPKGYTEESWKEHMSHHPNMYKECLI